jgi:hypothetical protein
MKALDAVKIAGIVGAGVVAFLLVRRVSQGGQKVVDAAVSVITKDLNPASPDNVIYKQAQPLVTRVLDAVMPDPLAKVDAAEAARKEASRKAAQARQASESRAVASSIDAATERIYNASPAGINDWLSRLENARNSPFQGMP